MFTTAMTMTAGTAEHDAHVRGLLLDADREVRELRMLAAAGDLPDGDARTALHAAERRAAQRRARLRTLGSAAGATTIELETWHGDPRDAESVAVRAELQAGGLL